MVDLVRRLMFRALTQAKENPPLPPNPTSAEMNDHDKGVPVYSYHDKSGVVPFAMIPQHMEREKQIMKANTSEKSGKILLQSSMVDANGLPTEAVMANCQDGSVPILRVLLLHD